MKILKNYNFTAFGFDVILPEVTVKEAHGEEAHGEEYLDIDMFQLELDVAKQLILSEEELTEKHIKFLRAVQETISNRIKIDEDPRLEAEYKKYAEEMANNPDNDDDEEDGWWE